ncbi:TPA: efflux RND transporter periplasmic adaptor subunit [Burkholderia cepacia ATCC 25416]|uniref:HlyD family secretion protein n=1 Tax=Burkholderia cepacia TaxID=292 RepID=UPI001CF2F2E6|nr:efflux RND transporter periplasmic adaptor subunit [Burkholderia cepacia]HDR9766873.1 efflux RND transporter periplasmic adaptor subunit [Burkholderia cepacia ATCC 25416]MCA7993286.1 efflux RND transporter periplasmic adaptor subunit [Burkholderia cepacia]MCA8077572.1 efflux RND transporter periplasmic adaptor subunit [Burkholderia cepacia]HDR9774205.1 efflux RND transporter periplasmic adaptor subunit [Burkholderia cepacia ATCC 25416]HDR9781169.1 efflux RND transporter periplasmic adaptor 
MHHDNLHTAAPPAALNDPALDARRATRRKRFIVFFAVVLVAALAWIAYWLLSDRYCEDTDDAYVAGSIVQVAAQIPGSVTDVVVADTQAVRAGQTLVKLDDTEASVAFAQAKAQLAQAVRQVANAKISNTMYVEAVNARRADLSLAQRAFAARSGASVEIVAPEELARARAAVAGAQANLAAAQAQLDAARALGTRLPVDENPAVVQAAAQFKLAYRNLKRTTIVAPVDGTIGQRSVQVGQQVGPGVPLMSIVQLNQLWIEANFKEGQIRHMRIGQPVEVVSDLYGSRVTYRGRVQGFSAGTGSAFSMLPSQNAAGNWIKVVQRVPVVIALEPRDLAAHPLRVGLSMRATVDTHDRNGHALDSEPPTPAVSTRVHDGVASDAEAAAAAIIRENQGG